MPGSSQGSRLYSGGGRERREGERGGGREREQEEGRENRSERKGEMGGGEREREVCKGGKEMEGGKESHREREGDDEREGGYLWCSGTLRTESAGWNRANLYTATSQANAAIKRKCVLNNLSGSDTVNKVINKR